jgi:hypothetical protein
LKKPLRFVSIGGDCQVAHQIRRYSGEPDILSVFDWLECTLESVAALIDGGFADFFNLDNLLWERREGLWLVTDQKYSVASWHDFKTQDKEAVAQVCLMLRMLGRRFMDMLRSDAPVVFVRRWIELDGKDAERPAKRLADHLATIKPDSILLFLQNQEPRPPFIEDNYISVFNPNNSIAGNWEGFAAIYDRNFNRAAQLYEARRLAGRSRARA